MYLTWNGHTHDTNEAAISFEQSIKHSERGERESVIHTWRITGELQAADQATLLTKWATLEDAYSEDGGDLILYTDAAAEVRALRSRDCLGGVRITAIRFPFQSGVLSTWLGYEIIAEGEVADEEADNELLSWSETLTLIGTGGPRRRFFESLTGRPQAQTLVKKTTCKATQSGSAKGRTRFPKASPPLFPGDEHVDQRQISKNHPSVTAGDESEWGISWNYQFEAAGPLGGSLKVR